MHGRATEPSRVYFDHHLDSRRWEVVPYRADDIIVATGAKVGTTWTQRILMMLLTPETPGARRTEVSPWIDARFTQVPPEVLASAANVQTHRRFFKSHLPFDALRYSPEVKYIAVGRDGRDVALSLYNHYSAYTELMLGMLNGDPAISEPFPRAPADIHVFIREWLTRGNPRFPHESDGYPFWSHFRQIQSFWEHRDVPNVLLIHYQDLLTDLRGEAKRIAEFLEVEPKDELLSAVAERCTFDAMKREAMMPESHDRASRMFEGGSERFFNKGKSGRWKDVFTAEELALYALAVKRNLTPESARWLELGRLASGIEPSRT